ncbi:hypothetical protein GJ744_007748 [Endocarpon pusillum]|uniref:Uncharacterized protein n=1 Tax=Endocarpon pusillum TaxID=364733 RepID=A0A8H7AVH9_9EURO|nr:hypothetical protein GJ744_007748 [Endocarpon pusillum]
MPGMPDPSHEEMVELARKTRELIETIYAHPKFNTAQPERSPKMLWHTGDFARRTFTDYIAPLLPPSMASLKPSIAFADPRCEDPRRGMPGAPPRSDQVVTGEAANAWPEVDKEKYMDAVTRNLMVSMIILDPSGPQVQMMFPGAESGFDFGEEIREMARKVKE